MGKFDLASAALKHYNWKLRLRGYVNGKETIAKFLVGQVMKATKGQGNPALVNALVLEKLKMLKT